MGLLALAPTVSFPFELGEATVRSGIGHPLVVEIAYRLAPDEQLAPACIGLRSTERADDALPTYARLGRVAITPTHIEIFGTTRILEPLIGLTVDVRCPTAPRFSRRYDLLIDLPGATPTITRNAIQVAPVRSEVARGGATPESAETAASATSVSARARGQSGGALTQGQTYVVVRGDTLSGIANRVGDRRASLRETADAIFATNPGAFTRGSRDLIEAGRSIVIPVLSASGTGPASSSASPTPPAPSAAAQATLPSSAASVPFESGTSQPRVEVPEPAAVAEATEPAVAVVQPSTAAEPTPLEAPLRNIPSLDAAPATSALPSGGWTALLTLAIGIVLATALQLRRVRQRKPAPHDPVEPRASHPRTLHDPVAGFDVVEGPLADTRSRSTDRSAARKPAEAAPLPPGAATTADPDANPIPIDVAPIGSVDIDVGTPVAEEERVDWFADGANGVTIAQVNAENSPPEDATLPPPGTPSAATVRRQPMEPTARNLDATLDDQQHTLTVVELEMLRQDYEAEHTLTQEASKALRDAVSELEATRAARAAEADTATVEMPQQTPAEASETAPTQQLRASLKA